MEENRNELINALYKKTFGKDYSKYGDILQRYDSATGTLYCHTEGNDINYTKEQIAGAERYLQDAIEKDQGSGRAAYSKIALGAIKIMLEGQELL